MMRNLKYKYYIYAFLLPLFCQLASYAVGGFFPFGGKTVLVWDMEIQYISFFSWMNQVIKRQSIDSLLYSFSLSFGGSTAGLLGYYLMSPFNILLIPFSTKWLPVGVQIVAMLKICCCGLTMYHYLNRRFQKECFGAVLFSGMYALMGYTVTQQSNIMWLDGVMLLPVLLLNVYYLAIGRRRLQYPIWVAAAIITDFYIAYMILLFTGIYFFAEWMVIKGSWKWKEMLKTVSVFVGLTFLGLGISSAAFLPVMYEILSIGRGGAGGVAESVSALLRIKKDVFMLPLKCLVGAYDREQLINGLPNIYVSLWCLPFLILFFMDKRNGKRERVCVSFVFFIFLFSFFSIGLNQIWHGFTYTSGCNYRYSFCMSFLMIIVGYAQYLKVLRTKEICAISGRGILACLPVACWCVAAAYRQFTADAYEFTSLSKWAFSFFMGACACLFVIALKWGSERKKRILHVIFTMAMGVELVINMDWSMEDFSYADLEEYQGYTEMAGDTYRQLAEENHGRFFRMENELRDPLNDAMLVGYPSITHYSSTIRNEVADYAIAHHMLAEGYGRQATIYEIGRADAKETGSLAIKYLLLPVLPDQIDGWEIRQETPYYVLENKEFKPLCYLQEESAGKVEIEMKNSSSIKVHISDVEKNDVELLTSIPYREGWNIKVDGENYMPQNEDLMIRIKLPQGSCEVALDYRQPMLVMGGMISALALITWGMLLLVFSRHQLK